MNEPTHVGGHGVVGNRCAECGRIIATVGDGWWHVGWPNEADHVARPSKAPTTCVYCHGTGQADDANECGFCDGGSPLDTQEDWDRSWGRILGTTHGARGDRP